MPVTIDLTGKVAIVTGASRGIGRAIAARLAEAGARVAAVAKTCAPAAPEGASYALSLQADVSVPAEVERVVEAAQKGLGGVHILVSNAGVTEDGLLARMSDEAWRRVIEVNLTGAFLLTRAVARGMMKQREGRIVYVSSVVGLRGNAGQANYAASKAGLIGLAKSVARELAPRNVLANVVAPGFIETDMTGKLTDEQKKRALEDVPLERMGSAREVADAVLFLASPLAAYLTGAVVSVDGGLGM
jgi:3-oxoacyl-[acyl-carrier protein] reductase